MGNFKFALKKLMSSLGCFNLYVKIREKQIHKRNGKLLRVIGDEAIKKIYDIVYIKHKKPIWLEFGTMLGAYREHDYIAHDCDIDLGMFAKDWTPDLIRDLIKGGFEFVHSWRMYDLKNRHSKITEYTVKYKNLPIDIFLSFDAPNDCRDVYVYHLVDLISDGNYRATVERDTINYIDTAKYKFRGIDVLVPAESENYLRLIYGDDFMTPIKDWQPSHDYKDYRVYEDPNEFRGEMVVFADGKNPEEIAQLTHS